MRLFGERIRTARRKVGLSQQALAESLGVKRSAVGNWECTEGANPTVANMIQLAKTTQVAFEWLSTGRGPMALAHNPLLDISAVDADLVDDPQERRLLHAYRSASARMRITLLELVEEMAVLRTGKRVKAPPPALRVIEIQRRITVAAPVARPLLPGLADAAAGGSSCW